MLGPYVEVWGQLGKCLQNLQQLSCSLWHMDMSQESWEWVVRGQADISKHLKYLLALLSCCSAPLASYARRKEWAPTWPLYQSLSSTFISSSSNCLKKTPNIVSFHGWSFPKDLKTCQQLWRSPLTDILKITCWVWWAWHGNKPQAH